MLQSPIISQARIKITLLTSIVMIAFAANSLLCREALASASIGALNFTLIRLVSGAVVLWLLVSMTQKNPHIGGDWGSAAALFGYAAGFSLAYINLSAGTGALLLFGSVQLTMICHGLWQGERLNRWQLGGALTAFSGLSWLLLPGVTAPPVSGALLMIGAGISWGIYSLRGRSTRQPTLATAGNFIRSLPFALALYLILNSWLEVISITGVAFAIASGAIASGLGYALWYSVLPALKSITSATLQLSVPIIATLGGILILGESFSLRFALASLAVLGGLLTFILSRQRS
ncbi:MAG: DMT family transporter [Candidatus Thiodiazotropha sp.]